VGQSEYGVLDLAIAGPPLELLERLGDLAGACRTDRVALRLQPARGVDRQAPAEFGRPVGDQLVCPAPVGKA